MVQRRTFLQLSLGATLASPLFAALKQQNLDAAADVLKKTTGEGQVDGATLFVQQGKTEVAKAFGKAKDVDAMFLLGSISKPMSVAAIMTLFDQGKFQLDDPVKKFIPEFTGGDRDMVTIRHLLSHVSGLPDQLPENNKLRSSHAALGKFVEQIVRTPLHFEPGTQYEYSSMGIMLAADVAQRISGENFLEFIGKVLFQPLEMKHSALGLGKFKPAGLMRLQTEHAAPESGAGDPKAKEWDWNSSYWRKLGAPWGGVHASAPDVARFLAGFLHPSGNALKRETAALMLQNHNRAGLTPRGLGLAIGAKAGSPGCSEKTFGHSGSTGTYAWADPETDTICVVLTTLPSRAVSPHPTRLVSDLVAEGAG